MTDVTTTLNSITVTDAGSTVTVDIGTWPAAHATTHGAGGYDPITSLGTVAVTSASITAGTITTGTVTTFTASTASITSGTVTTLTAGTTTFTGVQQHALGAVGAPSVTFTGDTNTGIYSPGADQVAISTAGTARVRVDSSGNVGIGGTPSVLFEAFGSTGGQTLARFTNTQAGINYVALRSGATGGNWSNSLLFQNADSTTTHAELRSAADNQLGIFTGGTERLRIAADGTISGSGVSLGAWTAYTPTVTSQGGTPTTTTAAGRYTVIGKTCTVTLSLTVTAKGTATGAANLTLPFTAAAGSRSYLGSGRENASTGSALEAVVDSGSSVAAIFLYNNATPWVDGYLCLVTVTYEIA